jgi:cytochrome b
MNNQRELIFVWSRNIRLFHWVNVLAITLLIIVGLIIFNAKLFGITTDGKILLKTIHVFIGYVFSINLLFRLIIGFVGKAQERWNTVLPFKAGFYQELSDFKKHKKATYKGHNPAGKLMVLALISLMFVQMVTGLVIAGTDIYYPPFGKYFAESIAVDKQNLESIKPYSKDNVEEAAYQEMRAIRKPFVTLHVYAFYGLIFLIPLHILGVIIAERREKTALISAMITGYKYLPKSNTDK